MIALPPFPTDDATLDLLWMALDPNGGSERSSIYDLLGLFSMMGGSDPTAEEEEDVLRDPQYHVNDVIVALVTEVRRLRETAHIDGSNGGPVTQAQVDEATRSVQRYDDTDHV